MSKEKKNQKPQLPNTREHRTKVITETRKIELGDSVNEDRKIKAMEVPKRPVTTKPKEK